MHIVHIRKISSDTCYFFKKEILRYFFGHNRLHCTVQSIFKIRTLSKEIKGIIISVLWHAWKKLKNLKPTRKLHTYFLLNLKLFIFINSGLCRYLY
jgi:hypothetical protein